MPKRPIPILMYHSIEAMPKSTIMRSLHVPPKRFGIQMWRLNMLGYKGLSMSELTPYLEGEKTGKVVWKGRQHSASYYNNPGSKHTPFTTGEEVIIRAGSRFYIFNKSTGKKILNRNMQESNWKGVPEKPVIFNYDNKCVILLNAISRQEIWKFKPDGLITSDPILSGNNVLTS